MLTSDKRDREVTPCIIALVSPLFVPAQPSRRWPLRLTVSVEKVGALVVTGLMLCVTSVVARASCAPGIDPADQWPISASGQQTLEMVTALGWLHQGPGLGLLGRRRRTRSSHPRRRSTDINSAFLEHYRCPEQFATFSLSGNLPDESGYFRFGPDAICYGKCSSGFQSDCATGALYDALAGVGPVGPTLRLPFDPSETVANLRHERYASASHSNKQTLLQKAYYMARPLLAQPVRKHIQRARLRDWQAIQFPQWPVDSTVENIFERLLLLSIRAHAVESIPFVWFWPEGFQSCAIMTHDVETATGSNFATDLMDLDDAFGIKSSFQIVPEGRYAVSDAFLAGIRDRGFEVNVHDLNHDGGLFRDRERFLQRAERINSYAREFGASGFRSGVLYRNPDWLERLHFSYDMSIPNAGHLEAQRGGCCSVTPFFIGDILELPVTTTQDYSLFHILNQYSLDVWKRQIDLLRAKHGLISFIVHPDYIVARRGRSTYEELLGHLRQLHEEGTVWFALPGEVDRWWRERSQMRVVRRGSTWAIEGRGAERAQIAHARIEDELLVYRLEGSAAAMTI